MHTFRTTKKGETKTDSNKKRLKLHELCNGPSKLCMSFAIRRDNCDQLDMVTSDEMWLEESKDIRFKEKKFEISTDKRIGIDSTPPVARNRLWRFYVKDSWSESRAKIGELKKKAKEGATHDQL